MSSVDESHDSDSEKTVEAEAEQTAETNCIAQTHRSQSVAGFVGFCHGAYVLPPELVAKVFEFDDDASEARACCVAKGWATVRRGPPWVVDTRFGALRVLLSPDGSKVAVSGEHHPTLEVYDTSTGERLWGRVDTTVGPQYPWTAAFLYPDGAMMAAVGGVDRRVCFFDAATGESRGELDVGLPKNDGTESFAFLQDGLALLIATLDGRLRLVDVSGVTRLDLRFVGVARECTLSPECTILAVARVTFGPGGRAVDDAAIYNVATRALEHRFVRATILRCLAFSPDSTLLAVCDDSDKLSLFDTWTGQLRWEKEQIRVSPVTFSPDGAMVAAGGYDGITITLYDTATGEERRRITRDRRDDDPIIEIRDLAWSVDGLTLAAGGTERIDFDKAKRMGKGYSSTRIGRVVLYGATGKARIMKRRAYMTPAKHSGE